MRKPMRAGTLLLVGGILGAGAGWLAARGGAASASPA
jgi:hypothetical protein